MLDKIKELEDIIIDFNEYLETVLEGLKQIHTGVKAYSWQYQSWS